MFLHWRLKWQTQSADSVCYNVMQQLKFKSRVKTLLNESVYYMFIRCCLNKQFGDSLRELPTEFPNELQTFKFFVCVCLHWHC